MSFTIATLWLYTDPQRNKYQGHFLIFGAAAALLAAGARHLVLNDITWMRSLRMYLPLSLMIATLGSTIDSRRYSLRHQKCWELGSKGSQQSCEKENTWQENTTKGRGNET